MTEPKADGTEKLQRILEAGRDAAAEVCRENERLRQRVIALEHELAQVKNEREAFATAAHPDCEQRLTETLEELERLRAEHGELTEQYIEMERQNTNFISLYVASNQLHSTLQESEVLRSIQEIVINLIGAEKFAIYLLNSADREFVAAATEGLDAEVDSAVPFGDNQLSRVANSGTLYIAQDLATQDESEPLAILPLVTADQLVGLLVVHKLLIQKDGFEPVDLELFDLLAGHAATALMSSRLHTRSERKANTLQGLITLIRGSDAVAQGSSAE